MNRVFVSGSDGMRVDAYIAKASGDITRSQSAALIEEGRVRINGVAVKKNRAVRAGDRIEIDMPEPEPLKAEPENIPLRVIYEDDDIIVIDKPKGMVVHPAAGNYSGTLVNALLWHCKGSLSGIGGVMRPGIVHRLDKDTSGLVAAAKNDFAHISLSEQLKNRTMKRVYYALVRGKFAESGGTIDLPIGRDPLNRKRMAVILSPDKKSRRAVTRWSLVEEFDGVSHVKCELETGRTHQIRVHMAYLSHPLIGDAVYSGAPTKFERENKDLINGQCLYSGELEFTHPRTSKLMRFEIPPPEYFDKLLSELKKRKNSLREIDLGR